MQKSIDVLLPNLVKPTSLKAGGAGSSKASASDDATPKGIGNPFAGLLKRVLKNRANAQTTPPQATPEPTDNASDSVAEKSVIIERIAEESLPVKGRALPKTANDDTSMAGDEKPDSASGDMALLPPGAFPILLATEGLPAVMGLGDHATGEKLKDHAELSEKPNADGLSPSQTPSPMLLSLQTPLAVGLGLPTLPIAAGNQFLNAAGEALPSSAPVGVAQPGGPILLKGGPAGLASPVLPQSLQAHMSQAVSGSGSSALPGQAAVSKQLPPGLQPQGQPKPMEQPSLTDLQSLLSAQLPKLPGMAKLPPQMEQPGSPALKTQTPVPSQLPLPEGMAGMPLPLSTVDPLSPVLVQGQAQSLQISLTTPGTPKPALDGMPGSQASPDALTLSLSPLSVELPSSGGVKSGNQTPSLPLPGAGGSVQTAQTVASAPVPPMPTLQPMAAVGQIQAHLQAMGGTIASAGTADKPSEKTAGLGLAMAPSNPGEIGLSLALNAQTTAQKPDTPATGSLPGAPNPQGAAVAATLPKAGSTTDPKIEPPSGMGLPAGAGNPGPHGDAKSTDLTGKAIDKNIVQKTDKKNDLHPADDLTGALKDAFNTSAGQATGTADTSLDVTATGMPPTPVTGDASSTASTTSANGAPLPKFSSAAHQPADQVADGTLYGVKNGHKELIIRLNPDNLGEVRINLTSHGNQEVSARMIATTQESHDLLRSQMDTLKQRLESQGLHVDRLSVVMAGGSTESQSSTGQGHHQGFHQETFTPNQSTQSQWQGQEQQANQGMFAQMQGQFQQKQGMAQPPSQRAGTDGGQSGVALPDHGALPETPRTGNHDNGRISILV